MTKDEIINTQDGQALADAVAWECYGMPIEEVDGGIVGVEEFYLLPDGSSMLKSNWQPHKPTEKGKAQCWDLMVMFDMHVDCDKEITTVFKHFTDKDLIMTQHENPQIAALKAALLSVRSE